jgi:hypothetical protein
LRSDDVGVGGLGEEVLDDAEGVVDAGSVSGVGLVEAREVGDDEAEEVSVEKCADQGVPLAQVAGDVLVGELGYHFDGCDCNVGVLVRQQLYQFRRRRALGKLLVQLGMLR